jgi:hypothetical protein
MKKILSVLVFSLLTFTFVGCEGFNQPSNGGSNQQQDEYYVKYSITTRQYQIFSDITYADISGEKVANKGYSSRAWGITIGPVKKGFRAYVRYGWGGGTCHIEVSKNGGPFAMKAEADESVSYTINF